MLGIANSLFDGYACVVQLKRTNCNALPVPLAKTGFVFGVLGGLKRVPKMVPKKVPKMDPKWTPKKLQGAPKRPLKVGSRKGSRKGYHSGKVNSEILLVFTIL